MSLDLRRANLRDRASASTDRVDFGFVAARQHLWIDREHWAPDAGVFVCTRCAVGTSARPQLDASIVEVLLKFAPLVAGGSSVFAVGSSGTGDVSRNCW